MEITLSPVRRDETLDLEREGDTLVVNGEAFDFSPLPDGATLPADAIASDWFVGPVMREDGALRLTLALPHGANAPPETLFPAPIIDPADGPIPLPTHSIKDPNDDAD